MQFLEGLNLRLSTRSALVFSIKVFCNFQRTKLKAKLGTILATVAELRCLAELPSGPLLRIFLKKVFISLIFSLNS